MGKQYHGKTTSGLKGVSKDHTDTKKAKILAFIEDVKNVSPTTPGYKYDGVTGGRMVLKAQPSQKTAVNIAGALHGCHSCGTKVATDRNQPWIGDHSPPTNLNRGPRAALGLGALRYDGSVKLRPQCDACSRKQSGLVSRLNGGASTVGLTDAEYRLLGVGGTPGRARFHERCIDATNSKVSESQGLSIQNLGTAHGCYSCGTRYAKDIYHADHNPPVCYTFSHVIAVLNYAKKNYSSCAGLVIPTDFLFLPQCPRCSHRQGGKMLKLAQRGKMLAELIGAPTYAGMC